MNIEKAENQLAAYGYSLTDTLQIRKGDKTFPVVVTAKGQRFYVKQLSGAPLWSGPDLGDFVKSFWYAKKLTPNASIHEQAVRHRTESEARDLKELQRKRIPWHSDHPEARAYRQRYGFTTQIARPSDQRFLSDEELEGRRFGMEQNSASYYVWVLSPNSNTPLSTEGPYGPHPLKTAEQMARIGAKEGIHDRAVSLGSDPEARSFRIERRYQARSGERII